MSWSRTLASEKLRNTGFLKDQVEPDPSLARLGGKTGPRAHVSQ